MITEPTTKRPEITFQDGKVCRNGTPTRVVLAPDNITVGCTDITPEAAKYILKQWTIRFGEVSNSYVLQP